MNTPTIKAIDRRSVHQICSGQVVVTLCTALKELVENSLDAGATNIEIRLKNWGADSIEVIDNGPGVLPENFQALVLKHHTSKLNVFADLVGVETFGFRGEALSSLCALSELSITTCHHSKSIGARIEYNHDGRITKQAAAARVPGTTVTLLNLFSTLPVRHKEFLRNLKREYAKLIQVLQSYCVISTGVRFSCYTQSEKGKRNMVLSTNGNVEMKENISNVFGPKQLQSLLVFQQITAMREDCEEQGLDSDVEIDDSCTVFRLTGFVSRCDHGAGRSTSDRQYIFINRRPCDLSKVIRVVNEVYHSFNRNQYPFLALNISLDKELVDVNVTPDKRQVFLQQEKLLLATIKSSLKTMFDPGTSSYELNEKPLSQIKLGSGMPKNKAGATEFSKSIKDRLLLANASNVCKEKQHASILDYTKKKLLDPHVDLHTRASLIDCSNNDCNNRTNISSSTNSNDNIIINSTSSHDNNNSTNISSNNINISSNNNNDNSNSSDNNIKNNSTNSSSTNSISISNSNNINNDDSTNNNTNNGVEQILLDSCVTKPNVENPESCCTEEKATHRMQSADAEENLCIVLESQDGIENEGGNDILEDSGEVVAGERHTDKLKRKLQDKIESAECSGESVRSESKRIKLDDEKAVTKRKAVTVEFDWQKLRSKMSGNSRENCTEKRSNSARTFRAAITPESNQSAEEELRRHITKEMFSKMEIIGQFNQGFVITKLKDDLFIIDQHASDEKYNFEEQQKNTVIKSQRLISPQALDLTAVNESILIEDIDIFKKNGFDFEIDEEAPVSQRVKLVSLPVSRNWSFGKSDIDELIFMLSDSPGVNYRPSNVRKMFASRACRMSIMVGTALNKAQMRRIVGHMGEMEHPWNCPHGRPTMRHIINLNMVRK